MNSLRGLTRSSARTAAWLSLTAAWLWASPGVAAQDPPSPTVARVEFTGLDGTSVDLVRRVARVRPGDPLDASVLDAAVTRLLQTGRFLSVRYELDETADGVAVTFHLDPRATVTALRFEGNEKYSDAELGLRVGVKVGKPVERFELRDGRESILSLYRQAGYANVTVTVDRQQADKTGEVVYTIDEGLRLRIRKILVEGNKAFDDRTLKKQIETRKAFWIIRTGAFDEDRAGADALRIQSFYRDQGFLDARAGFRTQAAPNQQDLTVIFTVEEGTRYRIEDIQFRGHAALTAETLLELIRSRVGGVVKRPEVDRDVRSIRVRYGELGYIDATVRGVRVFSDEPGLVRITIQINEGLRVRVGRVVVRGNARTRDKVVRRALNLYPPDDWFNLTEAREAERRLMETRIFDSVRVIPIGDDPGVRDVVIDVKEAEKTGDFLFGFGVTSNSGLVGSIVLDLFNFDLNDWPRNFSELLKFRSFFGGGQRLRIELLPGTTVSRFRIDFTEPYFLDKPVRFDVSAYFFERRRDDYNERRTGTTVSFGKRFLGGRFQGWNGELSFRMEDVNVNDVDVFASSEIRDDRGSNFLAAVKVTAVRDRTDNRFVPTSGDRTKIAYEQVAGRHIFGKLTGRYTWYRTLATDALERKKVLKLRAEGGVILGEAPVFERFFAGGTGSILGFRFRGVGERDGISQTNVGGDFLLLLSAEYSYPLVGQKVRGHVFLNTGTAGTGAYRAAVGTGVRFTLDLLGPVPLEFNLAVPVSSDSEDDQQVFSFLVGSLFR